MPNFVGKNLSLLIKTMRSKKRTEAEKAIHIKKITDGILVGKSHLELALELGVSRQTVQLDAQKIKESYLAQATDTVADVIAMELARLTLLYREAMEGYEKSKQQNVTTTTRTRMKMKKLEDGTMAVEQTGNMDVFEKKEQGIGNPAFLAVGVQIHDKIAKLLHLQGQTITHKGNIGLNFEDMTDEELDRFIEQGSKPKA